ncbi:MAG: ferrous iron transport protein A [Trichodesmium sp.]
MEKEYQDNLCNNQDQVWKFTFIGDSSNIQKKEKDYQVFPSSVVQTNFSLTQAKRGDRLCIVAINLEGDMTRRLKKMGLVVGVEVEVVSNNSSGSTIVKVENKNIGLGANPAENIIVSSLNTRKNSS